MPNWMEVCICNSKRKTNGLLSVPPCKGKGKGKCAYTWYSASSWWITTAEAFRYCTCSQGSSQFYLHTHTFIRNRNEPYLPLPSQPQLLLIYRPRRDGRLSRPWYKVTHWWWSVYTVYRVERQDGRSCPRHPSSHRPNSVAGLES